MTDRHIPPVFAAVCAVGVCLAGWALILAVAYGLWAFATPLIGVAA